MFTLPAAPRQRDSIRVVIADDDELYAESISCFLGYEDRIEVVGRARDGKEASVLAASLRPDVVVMDLEMPRMDGFEATRRIKRDIDAVSVVILSSSTSAEHVRRAHEAGAAAYVPKARAADELIPAILGARRPPMRRRLARTRPDGQTSWLRPPRLVQGGVDLAACLRGQAGYSFELLW